VPADALPERRGDLDSGEVKGTAGARPAVATANFVQRLPIDTSSNDAERLPPLPPNEVAVL